MRVDLDKDTLEVLKNNFGINSREDNPKVKEVWLANLFDSIYRPVLILKELDNSINKEKQVR